MEKYIASSLVVGIIHPSSSPAGAGFFFMDKKEKTLRPCTDYRGLNNITDNQLFEKAEFHASTVSFLCFIVSENDTHMDPAKVSAVTDWPTLTSRKPVQ